MYLKENIIMEKFKSVIKKLGKLFAENQIMQIGAVLALSLIIIVGIILLVSCSENSSKEDKETTWNEEQSSTTKEVKETTDGLTSAEVDTTTETTQPETTVPETTIPQTTPQPEETTTRANNSSSNNSGIKKLHVSGIHLVDDAGNVVVLNGVSTHGIAWFPQYVSKETFATVKDSFGGNVIRIAMYSDPNAGYNQSLHAKVEEAVSYATELGMYIIIDWHILSDGNPNTYKNEAIAFFDKMSAKYKDYNNVLYEICNEPNGNISWSNDVKPYAIDVIKTIRANDPDGVILVGTTTWSQDVDIAANDPITGFSNIMYTLHFYAATHKDWNRQKLVDALNKGLPVFVSEFSICDASGNGWNDVNSGNTWMALLDQYQISFVGWSLSNKAEAASIISSSCNKISGFSDNELTESGAWLVNQLRRH